MPEFPMWLKDEAELGQVSRSSDPGVPCDSPARSWAWAIRNQGLRPLTAELIHERIENASALNFLTPEQEII